MRSTSGHPRPPGAPPRAAQFEDLRALEQVSQPFLGRWSRESGSRPSGESTRPSGCIVDAVRLGLMRTNAAANAVVPAAARGRRSTPGSPRQPRRVPMTPQRMQFSPVSGDRRGLFCGAARLSACGGETSTSFMGCLWSASKSCSVGPGPVLGLHPPAQGTAHHRPSETASGEARRVDLGQAAIGVLLAHRLSQDAERFAWDDAERTPTTRRGVRAGQRRPDPPRAAHQAVRALVKSSGLRPTRLHDLRHAAPPCFSPPAPTSPSCPRCSATRRSRSPQTPTRTCSTASANERPRPPTHWSHARRVTNR